LAPYAGYLAAIANGAAKGNGIDVGRQVAQAVIDWRANDGFDPSNEELWKQLKPSRGRGVFESYPDANATPVDARDLAGAGVAFIPLAFNFTGWSSTNFRRGGSPPSCRP